MIIFTLQKVGLSLSLSHSSYRKKGENNTIFGRGYCVFVCPVCGIIHVAQIGVHVLCLQHLNIDSNASSSRRG